MSDERLREAERRWRESGSVEDEAGYLLERVRAGTLSQPHVEIAALCGSEAAAAISAHLAPPRNLVDHLSLIHERSRRALLMGLLSAAERLRPTWLAARPTDDAYAQTLDAAYRSLDGVPEAIDRARSILADDHLAEVMAEDGPNTPHCNALELVRMALWSATLDATHDSPVPMLAIARTLARCAPERSAREVRDLFGASLREWALQGGGPLLNPGCRPD